MTIPWYYDTQFNVFMLPMIKQFDSLRLTRNFTDHCHSLSILYIAQSLTAAIQF